MNYLQCSGDLLRALVGLLFIVRPHEIEVGDLGGDVFIEKYIVWLQISMNDSLVMEKLEATGDP